MKLTQLLAQGAPLTDTRLEVGDLAVTLETPLRWLPQRRLTAVACWQGKRVVAKAYARSSRGLAEFRRERRALAMLHEQAVPAPACLAAAETRDGALLLLAYLDGDTATQRLAMLPTRDQRRALILDLATWVAGLHRQEVVQTDIHPGNFLYHQGQWFLLDAAACRFGPVGDRAAADNLAMLLAQFPPLDVPSDDALRTALPILPDRRCRHHARAQRYRHMLKKTLRDCTEFLPVRTGVLQGMMRRDAAAMLTPLLEGGTDSLDRAMAVGARLKDGGSATVVALPRQGWVLKRYNIKGRRHWLKRQLGQTRARRAWLAGHFLRFLGIATPRPVAFLEERRNGLVGRCWLITEQVDGAGLDDWPPERTLEPRCRQSLLDLFRLMADFRIAHGDLKASNLLLTEAGISVIDLDACRRYHSGRRARAALARDRARLLRNWPASSPLHQDLKQRLGELVP